MPFLFSDTLDDQMLFDVCPSFVGGQVSFVRPHLIGPTQAERLLNVDIAQNGIARTRRGTENLGSVISAADIVQGLCYFDTASLEYLIACVNQGLHRWDGATWTAFSAYSASTDSVAVEIVQGINLIYITDGVGHVFSWDGTTLVDLGNGAGDPPICKYLLWFTNRLFAAGLTVSDEIQASDFLDGATWDSSLQSIRVGAGEGDPITAICAWIDDRIVVGKRGSMWVVYADPLADMADWIITLVHRRIGCVSHRTMVQVGQDVWFLSDTGVRSVAKTAGTDLNAIGPAISYPVQDIIDRITWGSVTKACAVFWGNRYILSIPIDGSTTPNYALVFNTDTQSWSGYWTGWNARCFAITAFAGVARLTFGRDDGYVRQWMDYASELVATSTYYQDAGVGYSTEILTRALSFGEPLNQKKGSHVELEFYASDAETEVQIQLDQANTQDDILSFDPASETNTLPVDLPFDLATAGTVRKAVDLMEFEPFREIQFRIMSETGKLSVRGITAAAFVDTLELER